MKRSLIAGLMALVMVVGGCNVSKDSDPDSIPAPSGGGGTSPSNIQLPPDPASIAPPLQVRTLMPMIDQVSFLYKSNPPVQSNVDEGEINASVVSVVRGQVLAKDNTPLSGVKITILDHPEFGYTYSRTDGMFDMVVNGGVKVTVNYEKDGYLTIQRSETIPELDYFVFDNVVMTELDTKVTAIDLAAQSEPIAVVQGSEIHGPRGDRQSTLFFKQGTSASIRMPDGTLKPIDTLHIHSTEYTVGSNGPQAMPAELPPGIAYTYCVEFTVDEAEAVGGTGVEFSEPVIHYVENFVGYHVGDDVPTYYYNKQQAVWETMKPGKVIAIVSETGGKADIDIDGDGVVDDVLNRLGIDDNERERIAALYEPGDTLWRTPVNHFSPLDHNWPVPDPPEDATPPDNDDYQNDLNNNREEDEEEPCDAEGSILRIESRTLGEAIRLPGTDTALVYDSSRTSGDKRAGILEFRLLGDNWSSKLDEITVSVSVAGVTYISSYERFEVGLMHRFEWNGLDAYGRKVIGNVPVHVRIEYVYLMNDATTVNAYSVTTGPRMRNTVIVLQPSSQFRIGSSFARISREFTTSMHHAPEMPLGVEGWSLSSLHTFDSWRGILRYGDGQRSHVMTEGAFALETVVGQTEGNGLPIPCDEIDGKNAMELTSWINFGKDVGLDGQGNIYFMHECGLLRVAPAGKISLVMTMEDLSEWGFENAYYTYPIAVKEDGTVFLAERSFVVKIDRDGSTTLYAGSKNGEEFYSIRDLAVSADGTLYADDGDASLKKIMSDGSIKTLLDEVHWIDDLEVAQNGTVYVSVDVGDQPSIWKVFPDGTTESVMDFPEGMSSQFTVLDEGVFGVTWPEIGDAYARTIFAIAIAETSDIQILHAGAKDEDNDDDWDYGGEILRASDGYYLVDRFPGTISFLRQFQSSERLERNVFSSDGRRMFVFDMLTGRHYATYDALKGTKLTSFEYDAKGMLVGYTDRYGNHVSIEYGSDGIVRAIQLPHGRVVLGHEERALTTLSTPAGKIWRFEYESGGLLSGIVKPNGHTSSYQYDEEGALERVTNPGGAVTTLTPGKSGNGHYVIAEKTGCGAMVFSVDRFSEMVDDGNGGKRKMGYVTRRMVRLNNVGTLADINSTVNLDGTIVTDSVSLFDGTAMYRTSKKEYRGDSVVSYTPYLSQVTTPSGLKRTIVTTKSFDMQNTLYPMSLNGYTRTDALNGKEYRTVLDKASSTKSLTTPEGRIVTKHYNDKGALMSVQYGENIPFAFSYDTEGRLTQMVSGEDRYTVGYRDDGNGFVLTDPLGHRTTAVLEDGRVVEKRFADGRMVRYGYDGYGSLTSVTVPGDATYVLAYDENDKLKRFVPPTDESDTEEVLYDYRPDKKLTSITYKDGTKMEIVYDDSGRSIRIADVAYSYDPYGKVTKLVTDGGVTLDLEYDGFLPTGQVWSGAISGRVEVGYDNNFWPVSLAVNGDAVAKAYDDDGFLIQSGDMQLVRRGHDGRVTGTTLESLTTQSSYNEKGDVSAYEANGFARFVYARDAMGRIVEINETVDGASLRWQYEYDAAGRLSKVWRGNGNSISYEYDAAGHRTDATYDMQGRVIAKNGAIYGYDAAGRRNTRQVEGRTTTYRYNDTGDLIGVSLPDGTEIAYILDGYHRRIAKEVNGTRVWGLLYKDALHPVAQLDADGQVVARFVYADKRHVPSYMVKGGAKYRIVSDHLGSVRLVVNVSTNEVIQRIDYNAWGGTTNDTNPGFQPFGFAGGLYDSDTELVHFGAREYDPYTGSWLSRDPMLFKKGTLYLYEYAGNDPINRRDLNGMFWQEIGSTIGNSLGVLGRAVDTVEGILGRINDALGIAEDVDNAIAAAEEAENAENVFEDHLMTADDEVNEQAYELYNERRNGLNNFARACAALANDLNNFFGGWF